MKRTVLGSLLVGMSLCVLVAPAMADITLSIVPASQTVNVGDTLDVEVAISGLVFLGPPSLGAFDLDVNFDNSILAFNSATFGDPMLGDQLDLFGMGMNPSGASALGGSANIWEVSLDSPATLDTLQPGSFTLATLTFDAVGLGTSALSMSVAPPGGLADAWGAPLTVGTLEGGSATVVPAPGAVVLGAIGLGLVGWVKRRLS